MQLPYSFAWATPHIQCLRDCIDRFNQHRLNIEGAVVKAADSLLRHAQEVVEDAIDQHPSFANAAASTPNCLRPYIRLAYKWFDSIGYVARQSPLKLLVAILEIIIAVDEGLGFELLSLENLASLIGLLATVAASSDFVREHVRPAEFAQGKAREAAKKQAQLGRHGADAAIRRLLATPVDQVDVAAALEAIEAAEEQDVLGSLIDKAALHTQHAAQMQVLQGPGVCKWQEKA